MPEGHCPGGEGDFWNLGEFDPPSRPWQALACQGRLNFGTTIARKIADRPVLQECREARRQRGTAPRTYWWEQELDFTLDNERQGDADIVEDEGWAQPNTRGRGANSLGVAGDDVLRRRQRRELDEELAG